MAASGQIAKYFASIGADLSSFEEKTRQVDRKGRDIENDRRTVHIDANVDRALKGIGSVVMGIARIGAVAIATAGAAGIGALTYALVDGFGAAEEKTRLLAQTAAQITATGGAAGKTAADINALANSWEDIAAVDDSEILRGLNQLLSFTAIAPENFDRASASMMDLSVAMGKDVFSTATMLGKALNEPVSGAAALQKAGVRLTEEQKDQVQAFMDVNDVASAQGVIMDEIAHEYGGVAKAVGDQSPWSALKISIGDITENLGFALMPMLRGAAEYVQTKIVPAFSTWSGWMQEIWNGTGTNGEKLQASWDTFDDLLIKLGMSQDDAAELKTNFEEVGNAVKDIAGFIRDFSSAVKDNWDTVKPILEGLAGLWIAVKTQALLAAAAQLLGVGAAGGGAPVPAPGGKGGKAAAAGRFGAGVGAGGAGLALMGSAVNPEMLTSENWSPLGPAKDPFLGFLQKLNNFNATVKGKQIESLAGWESYATTIQGIGLAAGTNVTQSQATGMRQGMGPLTAAAATAKSTAKSSGDVNLNPAGAGITTGMGMGMWAGKPAVDGAAGALRGAASSAGDVSLFSKGAAISQSLADGMWSHYSAIEGWVQSTKSLVGSVPGGPASPGYSPMPGLAGGTNYWGGGLTMVGERGPELVNLPRGSKVTPNSQLPGGTTVNIYGNIITPNPPDFSRQLSKQIRLQGA